MTSAVDTEEVMGIVGRIGPVVLSSAVQTGGDLAVALRRCVGMIIADYNMVHIATFSISFSICVDLARQAGATLVTMDRVRKAALAETPVSAAAIQTVLAIVRLTLAQEARILAAMPFVSRNQIDATATAMSDAFSQTAEAASDDLDAGTYIAILTLQGDVIAHLADQGRKLPRVINYSYQSVMPALRMAQRAYADPSRYLELIAENEVVHPGFMPRDGVMLAV
jgi:prophage DNA circulation protein